MSVFRGACHMMHSCAPVCPPARCPYLPQATRDKNFPPPPPSIGSSPPEHKQPARSVFRIVYRTVFRTVPCVGSCVEFSVSFRSVALQVHPPQPVPDVDRLPVPAGLSLREAADVREAQHGHLVPHLLLPAGELPAVPCGARVEAAVLAVPQEVHDVVPGTWMCVWCVSALAGRPMKNVCVSSVYSEGRKEGTKEGRTGWCV